LPLVTRIRYHREALIKESKIDFFKSYSPSPAKNAVYLFSFSFLVSFSRIYVGVHYPADVVAGMVIGLIVGFSVVYLWIYGSELYKNKFSAGVEKGKNF